MSAPTETTRTEGTRIFNHGDMANVPHWGTIVEVKTDDWGTHYTIRTDAQDSEFGPEFSVESYTYTVQDGMIQDTYKGNGLTRIVTEEAYQAWRAAEIAKLEGWRDTVGMTNGIVWDQPFYHQEGA